MEKAEGFDWNGGKSREVPGKRPGSPEMQAGEPWRKKKKKKKHTKSQSRPIPRAEAHIICVHYMNGRCKKESGCNFSHQAIPFRKQQLCKHYVTNNCQKGNSCLYMHQDFPCKFFAKGRVCHSGDKCKFSHAELNDTTRAILDKHLSSLQRQPEPTPTDQGNNSSCRGSTELPVKNSIPVIPTENVGLVMPSFYQDSLQDDSCQSLGEESSNSMPIVEIYASETSHPPMVYRLAPVSTSRTDYSTPRFEYSDSQVHNDPRLRKFYTSPTSSACSM